MDKYQTLHEKDHPENSVYPNIQPINIPSGAIDTSKLADSAVTSAKIADSAVTTAKINDGAVTRAKIALGAIGTDEIEDGVITSAKIADANITTAKINDGAVTTAKIANRAITNDKLGDASVDSRTIDYSIISIADYFVSQNVTDLSDAMNALTKLYRDMLVVDTFVSADLTDDLFGATRISVDRGNTYFEVATLKSGGWTSQTISNNTQLGTFMAGDAKITYVKVIA